MDTLYYITGIIAIWSILITSILVLLALGVTKLLNYLGRTNGSIWIIVEYAFYRKQFKEWVKDKERINQTKNKQND